MKFTVCVLFYGNHPELTERLLAGLARPAWHGKFELRIGMNKLSNASVQIINKYTANVFPDVKEYIGRPPFYKYPLMRDMFCEPNIATPYTQWFDDDSWITSDAPDDWFDQVEQCMATKQLHVAGAPYFVQLRGNQHQWIEDQPWYTGKPVSPKHKMDFITGGWLAIRTELIHKYNWPPVDLIHNGGDVMLGALCYQQGLRTGRFTSHLGINANNTGKCSTATRRGASLTPCGVDYQRQEQPVVEVAADEWMNLFDGRSL